MNDLPVVVYAAYRGWAKDVVTRATCLGCYPQTHKVVTVSSPKELDVVLSSVLDSPPAALVLVGWSWMVPPTVWLAMPTFVLHPSPLPLYRGGSPLQHQIIHGEATSAVTVFKIDGGYVDSGPIAAQAPISLDGSLSQILDRVVSVGAPMVRAVVDAHLGGTLHLTPQDRSDARSALIWSRRTPEMSEIRPDVMTGRVISDTIRALDHDDYPRAFIRGADGVPVELGWRPQ